MYTTAQRAFGVSPDRHYRLLHAAVEEKPKIIVLSVIVQEAEGLEAKDANGKFSVLKITPNANLLDVFIAPCCHLTTREFFLLLLLREIRWKKYGL